jgi:lipopolysaccharide export system protein LptC
MRDRISFFTTLILLIISATCWLAIKTAQSSLLDEKQNNSDPDFFMQDVVYLQMDDFGKMQNKISTPSLTHYALQSTYVFSYPRIEMLDKNNDLWLITANNGKSINDSETVFFWDNVEIKQFNATATLQKSVITTSAATIYPHRKFAETDQPILFNQGGSVVQSTGAKLDLESAKVQLLSKVRGIYESAH